MTGRFFPAILADMSITCAPVPARAAGIEPAGSPTAMPTEGLGMSGPLRASAGL